MKFVAAALSETGPRSVNEDEVAFWPKEQGELVAAVADGLGGMGGGEEASRIAIGTLIRTLDFRFINSSKLIEAVEEAHKNIISAQQDSPQLNRMATTLTAGFFSSQKLIGVHCGDTRASIARGSGILRLTKDHSEGERFFQMGKLTKQELLDYPRKNILDSALGIHNHPKIDTFEFELAPKDKIFFTTDGVHGKVLLRELREVAERFDEPNGFVREVATLVSQRSPDDNYSIVAVFVD